MTYKIEETPVRLPTHILEDAFFFWESNRALLNGNPHRDVIRGGPSATAPFEFPWGLFMIMALTLGFIVVFPTYWVGAVLVGGATLLIVAVTDSYNNAQKQMQRLSTEGHILSGELMRCVASMVPNPMGKGASDFYVSVEYRFLTPNGTPIHAIYKEARNDLNGTQLPVPGTPLYVLYFNDREYHLL